MLFMIIPSMFYEDHCSKCMVHGVISTANRSSMHWRRG